MGRKPDQKEPAAKEAEADAEVEDTPFIKELKEIDDRYHEIDREYEAEVQVLRQKYELKLQPMLDERTQKLTTAPAGEDAPSTGTPACPGFWLQALQHFHPIEDMIQPYDEPVLQYLKDITKESFGEGSERPFKLMFHFAENPYFENTVITKEYNTELSNQWSGDVTATLIKCDEIKWKAGKDVTVEKVAKKVKGGGAKKAKQKKEKKEPRESVFRFFFRTLNAEDPCPKDLLQFMSRDDEDDSDDDEGAEQMMEEFMENDLEIGMECRDRLIPYAVRWYTGEAAPDMSDDDDEDEESEDEDDESDEDSDSGRGKKGKGKPALKGKKGTPKGTPKDSPATGPAGAPKEECKQQ